MKPNPLSSLNHLTVPVAIAFLLRLIVLRTRRLLSKGYDRWHCDVGRITQPDLATVAAATSSAPSASRREGPWSGRPPAARRAQPSAPAGSTKRSGVRGSLPPERPKRGPCKPLRGAPDTIASATPPWSAIHAIAAAKLPDARSAARSTTSPPEE